MSAALWLLIGLQLRGWVRYFLRGLLTLKGALQAILGGTVFALWLLTLTVGTLQNTDGDPTVVPQYGPGALLCYCILNVLLSSNERGIYFTPAEVNYLFPAPLSRRELLGYKIASSVVVGIPSCLILSIVVYSSSTSFLRAFFGMLLIVMFMQLFAMAFNLIAVTVGARLYSRGRKLLVLALILLVAALVWRTGLPERGQFLSWLHEAEQSVVWQTLTLPLACFFKIFSAKQLWPELVAYTATGLLVNGVLLGVVFALDAHYLEASASASARIYARLQRIRTGAGGAAPPNQLRFTLPMPPSLGGIGTLCWRQLTTTVRMPARLLVVFVMFVAILGATRVTNPPSDNPTVKAAFAAGTVLLTAVFLSTLLPFDFRGDIDRMALLKMLPFPPWRLALGQVLAPVLIVSAVQGLVLALLFFSGLLEGGSERTAGLLQPGTILVTGGLFALPINGLLFALENLLFLLFPTRVLANNPADFQALGRNVLFMLAKLSVLGGVFLLASMIGLMIGIFFPVVGLIMSWLTLAFFVAPLIPLIGWAFTVFDVGRDTPA